MKKGTRYDDRFCSVDMQLKGVVGNDSHVLCTKPTKSSRYFFYFPAPFILGFYANVFLYHLVKKLNFNKKPIWGKSNTVTHRKIYSKNDFYINSLFSNLFWREAHFVNEKKFNDLSFRHVLSNENDRRLCNRMIVMLDNSLLFFYTTRYLHGT